MPRIVKHPTSGDRYILDECDDLLGTYYLASGPVYHADAYTQEQMQEYLADQILDDLLNDGEWLAKELGLIK